MVILRVFLYLVCITCVLWSILVFGGPVVIKRLITGYTQGAVIASDITVSPTLKINISRIDFTIKDVTAKERIEGFSRANELSWSFSSEKPLLDLKIGPSVFKNYASANNIQIKTPPYREINWDNIFLSTDIQNLEINSYGKTDNLTFDGVYNSVASMFSNIEVVAEKISAEVGNVSYMAKALTGQVGDLNFNVPFEEQSFSGKFLLEDGMTLESNLSVNKATVNIAVNDQVKNIIVDLHDVNFLKTGGFIEQINVDGKFDNWHLGSNLSIDLSNGFFIKESPKFSSISAKINKLDNEIYDVFINGNVNTYEISNSNSLLGILPQSYFAIDVVLDRENSKLTADSKLNFNNLEATDIYSSVQLGFGFGQSRNIICRLVECEFSEFQLAYEAYIGDEWIKGGADCPKISCRYDALNYFIQTSNTIDIFTILNQVGILTPLSSLYLYSAISSGKKIVDGHELKFQF